MMDTDYFQQLQDTISMLRVKDTQCFQNVCLYILKDHNMFKKEANPTSGVGAIMIKYGCFYFLDLIAIPDFASGAMENWGLITYRETSLLFDPKTSSTSDKLWVTKVIAHELAHQVPGSHGILLGSVPKSIMQNTPSIPQTM